jgi:hypothetical protein
MTEKLHMHTAPREVLKEVVNYNAIQMEENIEKGPSPW